uniref:FBA_2 domain-containing protein n=2 Tax=Caenorhabditis tropicalis TaxID=1561998 RepID=A0A1I7TLN8_9PELO
MEALIVIHFLLELFQFERNIDLERQTNNVTTEYVSRMPAIVNIDKMVPKRINRFETNAQGFVINDRTHRFVAVAARHHEAGDEAEMAMGYEFTDRNGVTSPRQIIRLGFFEAIHQFFENHLRGSSVYIAEFIVGSTWQNLFPQGTKIIIGHLKCPERSHNALEALTPFIESVKKITVRVHSPNDPVFENEIIGKVEKLVIDYSGRGVDSWTDLLRNLPVPHVHMAEKINLLDLIPLINMWISDKKKIGTKFTMQATTVPQFIFSIVTWLKAQKKVIDGRSSGQFPFVLTLPIDDQSELIINGSETPAEFRTLAGSGWPTPQMLVIEVMPKGTADEIDA